jgi:predicted dehydrogenase/threonine dehydrogenase-like Zn-dependent dehydrogenase
MFQVVQDVRSGDTGVREIPDPVALPGQVVVRVVTSLVSAGTERYVVDLARKSLLGKARERPDHVRRVMQKIKQEGFRPTISQVFAKLDEPMPLGYSSAGFVLECGRGVQEFKPGDRVATAGPHAGVVSIGKNLCARVPEGVSFEQASYTSVASIALEGIRLARVTLGERVLVIGLGLVGQICVCLLKAQGCRVFGTDIDSEKLELARTLGADEVAIGSPLEAVRAFSDSFGVDAAIITAATTSNEPIEFAAEACRSKGRIVLVGVAGLNLPRDPFFKKELEFTVSSSLGPGRGDPAYEEKGIDYPIGHARWTAQRNMQTVLETMAAGKLPVEKLTTHRFDIENAGRAYDLITSRREPFIGILIDYYHPNSQDVLTPQRKVVLRAAKEKSGALGISMIGAGNFARLIMFPILSRFDDIQWRGLCTAKGMNAEHSGRKMDFAFATTDFREVLKDESTEAVFIATRHDLHAKLVIAALGAGKHVFVEKPLCINPEELDDIAQCVEDLGAHCPVLMVGFNRRFAPATARLRSHFTQTQPLSISYRFAPGALPASSWPQDEEIGGGRIIGEACHAIDTCIAVVGSTPVKVYAESVSRSGGIETTDDRVFITMRHEDGSISNVSYQAGGDRAAPVERIEVFGGGRTGVIESWNNVELWSGNKLARVRVGNDKGHQGELKAFIRACRDGGDWPIAWKDLYGTAWASLAAVQSLRSGLPIEVE